jgi:hypothetical protein
MFRVLGTDVRYKFFVPLRLEIPHHFVHSVAKGRSGRNEYPGAVGASPTLNTLPKSFGGPRQIIALPRV